MVVEREAFHHLKIDGEEREKAEGATKMGIEILEIHFSTLLAL